MNNEVTLQGKLVEEVALATSQNGNHYANGKLAVEHSAGGGIKTTIYPFTVFGATADQLSDYRSGAQLEIVGQVRYDSFRKAYAFIGKEVKRPQEVGSKNSFKLSGFVQSSAEDGALTLTKTGTASPYVNFGLAVKRDAFHQKPAQYDVFYLTAFGNMAEQVASSYHKGDLVEFRGRLSPGIKDGISLVTTSGKLVREAETVREEGADHTASNDNAPSAKAANVHEG